MKVLFVGDVVGDVGLRMARKGIAQVKKNHGCDMVIVNGENVAPKNGITHELYQSLRFAGADVVTLGNHAWDRDETAMFIQDEEALVRPANYPPDTPGRGYTIYDCGRSQVAVAVVMGNVYVSALPSPFTMVDALLAEIRAADCETIIVDVHGEATSEKIALGHYLDGRVSAVIGTHTHVQTADEKLLPGGTAYITDAGMTGPYHSVLGVAVPLAVRRLATQMPVRFAQADGQGQFNGVLLTLAGERAIAIERINFVENMLK